MSDVLNIVYIVAAVLLLFGAAVFVHELGHFLVARWCGMKVLEFAIGFGPKVFSRTRNGIEYSWRWIPAGGFVKLPQMITSEALEGKTDDYSIGADLKQEQVEEMAGLARKHGFKLAAFRSFERQLSDEDIEAVRRRAGVKRAS